MTDQLDFTDFLARREDVATPIGHGAVVFTPRQYDDHLIEVQCRSLVVTLNYRHEVELTVPVDPSRGWSVSTLAHLVPGDIVIERSVIESGAVIKVLVSDADSVCLIVKHRSWCNIYAYSNKSARAEAVANEVGDAIKFDSNDPTTLPFRIWNGGESEWRTMPVRTWSSIEANYPAATTRRGVGELMALKGDSQRGGSIIIWHGEPGTGKTNALVALATEWDWCQVELVSDADLMLNNHKVMANIIQASDNLEKKGKKARLLIFEDADGLVVDQGYKGSRSGGMARLLNLADGLLGMNQQLMMLFTTNAAPEDLDPALSRPGRCLAHTKFDRFEIDEIRTSFPDVTTTKSMTLAEIWGAKSGQVNIFDASHPTRSGTYL